MQLDSQPAQIKIRARSSKKKKKRDKIQTILPQQILSKNRLTSVEITGKISLRYWKLQFIVSFALQALKGFYFTGSTATSCFVDHPALFSFFQHSFHFRFQKMSWRLFCGRRAYLENRGFGLTKGILENKSHYKKDSVWDPLAVGMNA